MASMARRIPPRGTVEFRRYWRDKAMWQNLEEQVEQMQHVAENTEPHRREYFNQALICLKLALEAVKEGWKLHYIKSSESDKAGESNA